MGRNHIDQLGRAQVNRAACALLVSAALLPCIVLDHHSAKAQGIGAQPGPMIPPTVVPPISLPAAPAAPAAPAPPPGVSVQGTNSDTTDSTQQEAPQATGNIAQINIKGNASVSTQAILALISQKVGDAYVPANADKDRDTIKGMGYFNGDIGLSVVPDTAGGLDLTYTVAENPIITKVVLTANTPDKQPTIHADILRAQMVHTHDGQVLNTNGLNQDLDALFNRASGYCRKHGYLFEVSSDINFDPQTGVLTIPIIEAHIDAIKVTGNKKTKTKVIIRELRQKPGDVLNEIQMQKDLTKVYNLGIFDSVGPFEEIPTDVGLVTISIPVTDKRTGNVTVGVGYSSQSQLEGTAGLSDTNFRGLDESARISWEVGDVNSTSSVDAGFTEPYLDKHHTALDVDAYDKAVYRFSSNSFGGVTVGDSNTYTEQHIGGQIGIIRPIGDNLRAEISVRSETVRTNDVSLPQDATFIRQNGNTTSIAGTLSADTRDNVLSPASGGLATIREELATSDTTTANNGPTPLEPGQHTYLKSSLDLRRYISLQGPRKLTNLTAPKKVFAVHLFLQSTAKEIPFSEQYFLGGPDDLRGYDVERYWGNNSALGQAELRLPIGKSDSYQLVILGDVGDAWGSIYSGGGFAQHEKFTPLADYGLGVRLKTPVGPIRLDYAIGSSGGQTQFSIGPSF